MKIEEWNAITKDTETQADAEEGDLCTVIDGVAFLIQRRNDFNNVVCKRIEENKTPITKTFVTFRAFCVEHQIQYLRIEGISHKYKMLKLCLRECPECVNVVQHLKQSEETGHTIWYVKTY